MYHRRSSRSAFELHTGYADYRAVQLALRSLAPLTDGRRTQHFTFTTHIL